MENTTRNMTFGWLLNRQHLVNIWSNRHYSRMQDRRQAIVSISLVIQLFVGLFVISFAGILVHYAGGMLGAAPEKGVDLTLDGVVLSMKDARFQHTRRVLTSLGIKVVQKVPPAFESKEVDQGLERHVGSRQYHTPTFLKVWSNRMAFMESMESFVLDSSSTSHTWRFFFEDDLELHPNITAQRARTILAKALALAGKDGFMYLGICGPICVESQVLDKDVEAARCAGTCAHAFGFQQWKAGEFLTEMSALALKGVEGPVVLSFFFDRYLYTYGQTVQKLWVIGSNLRSPVQLAWDHRGLLFQDRTLFHSEIGK